MTEQPHFDDELTVLTARQVVPLQAIDTSVKRKRRWFLGGAFVVAMLLGAATAVVSAYLRLRNTPNPEIQTLSMSSVVEGPAVSAAPVVEEQPVVNAEKPKRPTLKIRNTDDTDKTDRTQPVLVDQWQERRARRVERRERARAQHNDRDLSNIDEIFEGRRRP